MRDKTNATKMNEPGPSKSDNFTLLCDLTEHHVISNNDIYALSQPCEFYSNTAKCLQGKCK